MMKSKGPTYTLLHLIYYLTWDWLNAIAIFPCLSLKKSQKHNKGEDSELCAMNTTTKMNSALKV